MATTKSNVVFFSGETLTAAATTQSSPIISANKTGYGLGVLVKLSNASAPTVAATARVMAQADTSTEWVEYDRIVGNTDSGGTESQTFNMPMWVSYVKILAGSNTGKDVGIVADGTAVTAI